MGNELNKNEKMSDYYKKYLYCKIKNIAVLSFKVKQPLKSYLVLLNELPDNCIRMHDANGWCWNYIDNSGVCKECLYEQ